MAEPFTVLIMAAGLGTRMRSELPKVLHPVCGRPMVEWVIEAAREAGAGTVVCVTRPGDGVAEGLPADVVVAEQTDGEGTGSAVLAARQQLAPGSPLLILSGDHPLVSSRLIEQLLRSHADEDAAATLLTTDRLDPSGYGRIVRGDDNSVERIVETKYPDGLPDEVLAIREINIGAYAFDADRLLAALEAVELQNGERYLTAAIPLLRERGGRIAAHLTDDTLGALGINTRAELMQAERLAQGRLIERHALAGVSFAAPETTSIDAGVEIGADTTIEAGVTIRGRTRIGAGCRIGPQSTLIDARLADEIEVPHSYLVGCEVEDGVRIGPFAYLRPGAHIGENAKVGTFVEIKNSDIGAGAKVPHLSYIGDADVGEEANVAAGNITANYDGRRKHRTKIGKRAKTGVDTAFVAPVSVGDDAYTGAGSVITEDVPDGALGISRPEQKNVEGYAKRVQEESEQ
jgi:bifunctional UDP-N-acetylglucosamine pyrophosphorylase / glucosamine-1-phosphate N-acetyltransferase